MTYKDYEINIHNDNDTNTPYSYSISNEDGIVVVESPARFFASEETAIKMAQGVVDRRL